MRLADHFLAARGSLADFGGFCKHMTPAIQRAQRFEVTDDVARAAGDLLRSKPSTLAAALPLCRLPYETIWIEYRGGSNAEAPAPREFDNAPTPWKQGVLIESVAGTQLGFMTFCWMHDPSNETDPDLRGFEHPVNISPISVYFDWTGTIDLRDAVREAHQKLLDNWHVNDEKQHHAYGLLKAYRDHLEKKWFYWADDMRIGAVFTGISEWKSFVGDARETEAMRVLDKHMMPGISPHGPGLIATILSASRTQAQVHDFMNRWQADMQGEAGWVQVFLVMLNSRNPVFEHRPVDLTKLNKARRKARKPELLPYNKTRLAMSRSQERIAQAHGIDREAARQHLVRGHFKIRRTGVYWWSPFLRGDARKGSLVRQEYEVT
jgi:hypothetical protein